MVSAEEVRPLWGNGARAIAGLSDGVHPLPDTVANPSLYLRSGHHPILTELAPMAGLLESYKYVAPGVT